MSKIDGKYFPVRYSVTILIIFNVKSKASPIAIPLGLNLNFTGKNNMDNAYKIIGATASHPFLI